MPLSDKVEVEVARRRFTLSLEGLTALEANSLAQEVTERMENLSRESKIVDSSKLAILTALQYAAELARVKNQERTQRDLADASLEDLIRRLREALGK